MQRRILGLVSLVGLYACGSAPPPPARPPPELILPEESASEQAVGDEEQSATAQPTNGPATLTVVTKVGGEAVAAHVKVSDASGAVLAEGASGKPLSVRAGELQIDAEISDSKLLHGHEMVHKSVSLAAGADATETVIFERCMLRVTVNIRGKLDSSAQVTLTKDGVVVAKLSSGDQKYVAVAPGRYEVTVHSKRTEIKGSAITLGEGATQTVPINVN
jgi:hypothetical protein